VFHINHQGGSNPESEGTQQVPKDLTLSYAEHSGRSSYRCQGGMVLVRRLERCLLSCAYHRQFLRFAFRGRHFQFMVLPFRLSLSPRVFTRCVAAALLPLQSQGMKILPYLDDWLICAPSRLQSTQDTALLLSHVAWLGLKVNLEKSCLNPSQSLTCIGVVLDTVTIRACPSAQCLDDILQLLPLFRSGRSLSPHLGQADSCLSCRSLGLVVTAPPAEMAERPPLGPQVAQAQKYQGVTTVPLHSIPMEGEVVYVKGRGHGLRSFPQTDRYDGCQPLGMGCGVEEQDSSGAVVCSGLHRTHQLARATSCAPRTQALPAIPEGEACACPIGQHYNSVSYKPPRGHQICTLARGVPDSPDLGSPLPGQPTGNVPTRRGEPSCRLPLPSQASTGGVAASSRGGAQHLGSLRQGRGRSLCLEDVDQLPPMVLLDGEDQAFGSGRPGSFMAKVSSLCLSTPSSDPTNTPQSASSGPQASSGGPLLASQDLFSLLHRLCCGTPWRLPNRKDLLSQLEGRMWHPDPCRLQLWVWPLEGRTRC